MKIRFSLLTAALLFSASASLASAQAPSAEVPQAPSAQRLSVQAPSSSDAASRAPAAVPADPFPATNPRFFTAATPTVETVNAFLHQVWGLDPNRIYRVMGIQTTPAPGVAKVTVFLTAKGAAADKVQSTIFYITPDGKHAIAEGSGVVAFGATPFASARETLKARADGPFRGATSKDLEIVEFADLQCPHCKEVQSTMDQIVRDFPKARVVFQLFPLTEIHSSAFKAAAYATCAQKQSNDAFFKFIAAVFDTQDALTPATEDATLKAAATTAGLDPDTIAACAITPATKDAVNGDLKLAADLAVEQTPMLAINGRIIPFSSLSYEVLKRVIQFQATLDGVDSGATAETLAPKPPAPVLKSLPK